MLSEEPGLLADPETPLSDARHTLGEVTELAQSMLLSASPVRRSCGREILALLGVTGEKRSDEKDGKP